MARRDVDLVIKARDQAASVVDSITKALNNFVDAQKNLDTRADRTENTLTALGTAIGKLDQQLKGMDAGEKLASELAKSAKALDRLEEKFAEASGEVGRLRKQLDQSKVTLESYTGKLERNLAVQERQKAVIAKAKADQRELTRAYEKAASAQEKLQRRQQKLPSLIEKASLAANKAARRFDELSAEIAGTEQPTRALSDRLESAQRRMTETEDRLGKLRAEFGEIGSNINAAGSAMVLFGGQADKAARNLTKQESILRNMAQSYDRIKNSTTAVSQRQAKLSTDLNRSASAMNQLQTELEQSRVGLDRLNASSDRATVELQDLTKRGFLALVGAARDQKRVMLETGQAYNQVRAEATKLGRALAQTEAPTREMVQEFERAAAESTRLKTSLAAQRLAHQQMTQTLRNSERSYEGLRGAQAAIVAVIDRLVASLSRADTAARRNSASVRALATTATQAAAGTDRLTTSNRRLASASERAAASTSRLAAAYRQFYGDSRRSLSLLQRIRGEVLSLIAAYGGLYGAITALQQTVDATQKLEAANARLNVAFNNDQDRVATEFDFLRRTADRLGISLGTLATEYSKFNVATQNTSLEGAKARRIFLQVAEAARVNRSSTKELSGVFVALTQIVSKGAVQMEELRQQLGDRLPGAIKIMADGLGVTTAELIKMMEQGQITEEALVDFADELSKRFGSGLPDALNGITVALGRLQNAAFQAAAEFGEGGFIAALTRFANKLTEVLRSADFEAFSRRVSALLGGLLDLLAFFADNFQIVFTALAAVISAKLTPIVLALGAALGSVTKTAATTTVGFAALQTRAAAMGVTITRTGYAVRGLTRGLKALLGTTGVGLGIVAITTALAAWSTEADLATEALNEHEKILDKVRNAYELVGDSVADWRKQLQGLTEQELENNIRRLEQSTEKAVDALDFAAAGNDSFWTNFFGFNLASQTEIFNVSRSVKRAVQEVVSAYKAGEISGDEFKQALSEAMQEVDDGSDEFVDYSEFVLKAADRLLELRKATEEAELAQTAMTGSTEEATEALEALNGVVKPELADKMAGAVNDLEQAMSALEGLLPKTKTEMESVAEAAADMASAYQAALSAARGLPDAIMRIAAEQKVLNQFGERFKQLMDSSLDLAVGNSLVDRIIGVESGGDATAKNPLSTATGLGQFIESTWLTLFKKYFADEAKGMTDAAILALRENGKLSREMVGLYMRENAKVLQSRGFPLTNANLYLAHFLGSAGAAKLLGSAPGTSIASLFGSDVIAANRSVLGGGATREDVIAWAQRKVGIGEAELGILERQRDALREQAELNKEQSERTSERIAEGEFALEQERRLLEGKEREAEIEKAIRQAREENPNITEEEIAQIRRQTGALFDLEQQRKKAEEATNKSDAAQRREIEREVNSLLEQQKALEEQLEIAREAGDTEKAENLTERLKEVNGELLVAIERAQKMWAAIGGPEADAAIARLDATAAKTAAMSLQAKQAYLDWSRIADLFVTGLASAFDRFAQAVANGENVFKAARDAFLQFAADFLIQIAQMIIKQAIFNALTAAFGGTPFGRLIGLAHSGGVVGSARAGAGNGARRVSPAIFAGAARYHMGGVAGLMPGEVPIIAKQGEEILTRDDPRHILNAAASGGSPKAQDVSIINTFDAEGYLEQSAQTLRGRKVLLNFMKANRRELKEVLS